MDKMNAMKELEDIVDAVVSGKALMAERVQEGILLAQYFLADEARFSAAERMISFGAGSVNEARAIMGLPPWPGDEANEIPALKHR